jgi:serine/threonine-protein kinase HipA
MRKLTVKLQSSPKDALIVGTLAELDRRIYFEYDPAFLATGIELSPFKLPARSGLIEHTDHGFGPLPGVFDDSLPDGWGMLLMDRHFRRQGVSPVSLSPLDRLAYLGTRKMGALTYHSQDPESDYRDERLLDLYELGRNAEEVLAGDAVEVLPQLMRAGGSPGGARPKVLVGVRDNVMICGENDLPAGFSPWIVKFAAKADADTAGPIEYAYSLMAAAAGIEMPETRLFEIKHGRSVRRYFAVRRFDRSSNQDAQANRRMHVHTFANLIHVNFRIPSTDYADLFRLTRVMTRNHRDVLRLFRLMVFNVVTHNRDDHAKNFAFRLDDQANQWSLAPAYDLTHNPGPGHEHTTTINGQGREPMRDDCLKLAEQEGISARETVPIIDQVNAAVQKWPDLADQAHCTKKVIATISKEIRPI